MKSNVTDDEVPRAVRAYIGCRTSAIYPGSRSLDKIIATDAMPILPCAVQFVLHTCGQHVFLAKGSELQDMVDRLEVLFSGLNILHPSGWNVVLSSQPSLGHAAPLATKWNHPGPHLPPLRWRH